MAYFTLTNFDADARKWFPQFGDYDRETVIAERADFKRTNGTPAKHLKVVRTKTAHQHEIDRALAALPILAA